MVGLNTKSYLIVFFTLFVKGRLQGFDDKLGLKYINQEDAEKIWSELEKKGNGYGKEWVYMPDGEGNPQIAYLRPQDNEEGFASGTEAVKENVHFSLYTRSNPKDGHPLSPDNPQSLKSSFYSSSRPTKIVIHGWLSAGDSKTVLNIKDAYLKRSDFNVIGVDWGIIASSHYYTAVSQVPNVGTEITRMIDLIWSSEGAERSDLHVIGHSLGAHIAGAAALHSGGKVSRVTGLDPALPLFQFWQDSAHRLDSSDANFVDVIHTSGRIVGMSSAIGHVDFYPNGGTLIQPGCSCIAEITSACSHSRSHIYFAESIVNETPFIASECSSWNNFKNGQCSNRTSVMGEFAPLDTRGVYYLMTNSSSPFSLGMAGCKYFERRRK